MLRKLFGFPPARLPRLGRVATFTVTARVEVAPHRRKPVLEALESRLLLSADPLGAVVTPQGLLALRLTDGDDTAVIQRIGEGGAGGDIVAVTLGTVTQQFGDEFSGILRLLIDAGAGDDWLRLVDVTVPTDIIGGLGTDTFEWQHGDATRSITPLDTGRVETVTFNSIEDLVGADDNRDTFLFAPGAGVSGSLEGGAGGFDSLVIQGGEYQTITVTASGTGAGAVALDDRVIAYDGIEPVTVGATAANLTLDATAGDDAVRPGYDAAAGETRLDSLTGTFPDVAFVHPTAAFTINLGAGDDPITIGTLDSSFAAALQVSGGDGRDRIDFAGTVATHGQDLGAAAETIVVAPGGVLRTDLGAGGAAGDLVLASADANARALGAAAASVTVAGGTLIAHNIALSATAAFAVNAAFIDGSSSATVAIFGGGEVAASGRLTIDVRSLVSAALDLDATSSAFALDPAGAEVALSSVATARIGDGAALAAAGDIAVGVVNTVEVDAGDVPASIASVAVETTAAVDVGATLTGQDVSLRAVSDATFAFADVVAVPEFGSATRAVIADEAGVRAMGAVPVSTTSLSRMDRVFGGDTAEPGGAWAPGPVGGNASVLAGALAAEGLRPDSNREPAQALDSRTGAIDDSPLDIAPELRLSVSGRPLADASEPATTAVKTGFGESVEDAIARELAAFGELIGEVGPKWGVAAPLAGMVLAANAAPGRAGLIPPLPAGDADGDARNRQRPAAEAGSEREDGGETGLGASLAVSVIKESAIAELARNVTSLGAVVLSASGTPFVRSRARGGAVGDADRDPGGALELREGDPAGAVVLAEAEAPAVAAVLEGRKLVPDYRHPSRDAGAGELVLATAARHDLIAEASGGAEPGTAVTAETPIDLLIPDATAERAADDTFTLALLLAAADASGAEAGGADAPYATDGEVTGLALSTHLPALAFEYFTGADRDGLDAAIRSGDDVGALVGERTIVVSGLLGRAVLAPAAAPGAATGHDVSELVHCLDADATDDAVSADALIGDSREVVIAYLGALAGPIAMSAGLTHSLRRRSAGARAGGDRLREGVPNASGYASRAAFGGHADAVHGGAWIERFVNDLGLAPEDRNPNANIKIKL